jgi:hypothetical protein
MKSFGGGDGKPREDFFQHHRASVAVWPEFFPI